MIVAVFYDMAFFFQKRRLAATRLSFPTRTRHFVPAR